MSKPYVKGEHWQNYEDEVGSPIENKNEGQFMYDNGYIRGQKDIVKHLTEIFAFWENKETK